MERMPFVNPLGEDDSMIPEITVHRYWTSERVRATCISNDLYTCGYHEDYEAMLNFVAENEPTTENLYRVAHDIYLNSEGQTVTNIMYLIESEAVFTTFEINGRDDI